MDLVVHKDSFVFLLSCMHVSHEDMALLGNAGTRAMSVVHCCSYVILQSYNFIALNVLHACFDHTYLQAEESQVN